MAFDFRAEMNRARQTLHELKAERGFYTRRGSTEKTPVTIRVHKQFVRESADGGAPEIERLEEGIAIIVWVSEVPISERGDVVEVEATGETFRVIIVEPDDGPSRRVICS